jgi:hypothetical protein
VSGRKFQFIHPALQPPLDLQNFPHCPLGPPVLPADQRFVELSYPTTWTYTPHRFCLKPRLASCTELTVTMEVTAAACSTCVHTSACSGPLHRLRPLPNSLQMEGSQGLSWLKKGGQSHGSSTASGKAREAWGTRDNMGMSSLAAHQVHPALWPW